MADDYEPAAELIARLERETGQRVDDPDGAAFAGLLGACSRVLGKFPSSYKPCDDIAAGMYIVETSKPEYREAQEQKAQAIRAFLLAQSLGLDD